MDRLTTKTSLAKHLESKQFPVIALTGAWGVGKSRLWEDLAKERAIAHGYVSLFGLTSAQLIKRHLAGSISRIDNAVGQRGQNAIRKLVTAGLNAADKAVDGKGALAAAVGIVGELAGDIYIDKVLEGQVVVLDDLERAHASLSMDSILGIIDELRRLRCQIVLVLNEEMLQDRNKWRVYHEKVVDIQLTLSPTGNEAIDVVLPTQGGDLEEAVRSAWLNTDCNNTRIAQRAYRTAQAIFGKYPRGNAAYDLCVADLIYLAVAEYGGFDTQADAIDVINVVRYSGGRHSPEQEEEYRRLRRAIPHAVSFSVYEDFRSAALLFLRTGHVMESEWLRLIENAERDIAEGGRKQRLIDWMSTALWDPSVDDDASHRDAVQLLPDVWRLDPSNAQTFAFTLKEIGANDLLDRFFDAWSNGINAHDMPYTTDLPFEPVEPLDRRITGAIEKVQARLYPLPSLLDALEHRSGNQYSNLDTLRVNKTTEEEWRRFLLEATTGKNLDLVHSLIRNRTPDITQGGTELIHALLDIVETMPDSKLARIIERRRIVPTPTQRQEALAAQEDSE